MRGLVLGAMAAAALGGAAAAEPRQAASGPVVYVCERGNYAERMLEREYGAAPFVTAAEVLATVRGEAPAWRTPRCMKPVEHARLEDGLRREREARLARAAAQRVLASR